MSRDLLQQALMGDYPQLIAAVRQYLAQPVPEPVAWYSAKVDDCITARKKAGRMKVQPWNAEQYDAPLYATPPAQTAPAVPTDMVMVPREPFPSQRIAGVVALIRASHRDLQSTTDEIAAVYRDMIAAAPGSAPAAPAVPMPVTDLNCPYWAAKGQVCDKCGHIHFTGGING